MKTMIVLLSASALAIGCGSGHPGNPAAIHAQAACNTWHGIVGYARDGQILPDDLDRMVGEASAAADANGRYTELWQDMKEYRFFAQQGMDIQNTGYVSTDCASI